MTTPYHFITLKDSAYPPLLREIFDPPKQLYVQGQVEALSLPQIAVVGSRSASPYGIEMAQSLASALVQAGFAITSGLARGIDAASHRGALTVKGTTIAVLGSGLSCLYPRAHASLALEIAQAGAVVSEFPLDTPPYAFNFPQRNRIISGLSLGTLVIEASQRSGSLITARLALEQGREVFALPGALKHPGAYGCNHLIQKGLAKLVLEVNDILEELPLAKTEPTFVLTPLPPSEILLDSQQKLLLECVGFELTTVDQVIERTGLKTEEVNSGLPWLQLHGYIAPFGGGYMRVK